MTKVIKQSEFHLSLEKFQAAEKKIRNYLAPTPLLKNTWLSEAYGCEVYLKLETMQPIGSFKIRGGLHKILGLTEEQKKIGVIAASAGNHAQGVAWGAKRLGVKSLIVMPVNAALVKVQNTKALGAEILLHGNCYDEAYQKALEIADQTQRVFIPAFDDEQIIAGQGTVGLEILEQLPDVDVVVGAVGGGGLMAGTGLSIKEKKSQVQVVGVQAQGAPAMIQAIQQGREIVLDRVDTIADGIAVMKAKNSMRELLAKAVDTWIGVEEDAIAAAILTLIEKAKIVSEGSGAVPLAALELMREQVRGKKVVLIMSGGNIDVNLLSRIIDRGLTRSGRRVRVNVWVSDRPGSLAKLTDLIAKQGANILQAIHDRNEPSTLLNQTEVALTLETRGPDHSQTLIEELGKSVIRIELAH